MKRLAALIFILALLLVPASAHEEEEVYTFPLEFTALASGVSGTPSPLALPQTGSFDPAAPTYGAQLKDDPLAVAAYELLETELAPGVTELSLDVAAYNLTPSDWLTDVTPALGSAVAAFVYDHPESQYCTIAQYGYATSRGQIVRVIYLITEQSDAAARQAALERMGLDASIVREPNDILGIEYCKAILTQEADMEILPIRREGSYHAEIADNDNPSATAVRELMLYRHNWRSFVPRNARALFEGAPLHTMAAGERAVLYRLRTMTESEFEALPYGSEGLWRKFMRACREEATLEDIIAATKSKRYTRTRIDRMVLCAFLGLTAQDLSAPAPYTRVLGFTDRGRTVLKEARKTGAFRNAGEAVATEYGAREQRIGDLYGLFCTDGPEAPGAETRRRVCYHKES